MSFSKYILLGAVSALGLSTVAQAQDAAPKAEGDQAAPTIVVFGQRAAQRKSIDQKKKANNQVEVITANDAGKLPDQNVGESVRRVPGVATANDQGEGRYVVIRGLDPNLAAVRINGQSAAAPEPEGRQVKLDDIPSGLVGQINVIKNQTADLDANAIAGAVDVKTLSAFDRKGTFWSGRYATGQFDLNDKNSFEVDTTLGGRLNASKSFGLVASINASRRPMRSNNLQGSSNWVTGANGFTTPDDFRLRDYNLVRARRGGALAADWRLNDKARLFARLVSSRFSDDETRDQFRIALPTTGLTGQTTTTGNFTGASATRFVRRRKEVDNIATLSVGGDFTLGAGKLNLVATHSKSTKKDPLRSEWQFKASGVTGAYDLSGFLFNVTPSAVAYDPTKFKASSFNLDTRRAAETLDQYSGDYTVPVSWFGGDTELKFGGKYSSRDKVNDRNFKAYTTTGFTLAAAGPTVTTGTIYDGRYPLGPVVDYDRALFYANQVNGLIYNASGSVANSLAVDYDVSEKIGAAYAMLTIKQGKLIVIPGLRVEDTKSDYKAKAFTLASTITQGFNVFGDSHYTDLFPSVVGRYDFSDHQVARFAVTTAIGRPNYADLAPYTSVDAGAGTVALGNPDLKPLKAVNFDLAYEHYVGKGGIFSASAFYKAIDNPIYSSGRTTTGQTYAGTLLATALVTQPTNADKAHVGGVELNAIYQFEGLPAPFDGLGASLNVTLQKSAASGLKARSGSVPLFYTSDTTGTAQITYEKYGVVGRVVYTYRSKFLDTVGVDKAHDIYNGENGQLDAKVSYALMPQLSLFAEATNLSDAPWKRYIGNVHQLVEQEVYGKAYRIGFESKF